MLTGRFADDESNNPFHAAIKAHVWRYVVLSLLLLLIAARDSQAARFVVRSCADDLQTPRNLTWSYVSNASVQFEAVAGCESGAGLRVQERFGPPDSTGGMNGSWTLLAPLTTKIVSLSYDRTLSTYADEDFRAGLQVDGTPVDNCALAPGEDDCFNSGVNELSALSGERLDFGVRCVAPPGVTCVHGSSIHSATAVMRGSTITLEDPVAPVAGAPTGSLFAGGWLRGGQSAQVTGSDAVGVKSFALVRDGEAAVQDPKTCDYGRLTPCALPGQEFPSELPAVDTATWADGVHRVQMRVVDAADNVTDTAAVEVRTDNTPPAAPTRVRNGRDAVWAPRRTQTVRWDQPGGQAAPITGAAVTACRGRTKPKCAQVVSATPAEAKVRLPATQGLYRGGVFLTDAAGNVDPANAGALAIGYDASRPNRPRLGRVVRGKRGSRSVRVRFRDKGAAPIARLAARVCRGSSTRRCRTLKPGGIDRVRVKLKRDGRRTLRVRVVDAAGNRSREARVSLPG